MPPINLELIPEYNFGISSSRDVVPDNSSFRLHNHNDMYEIVLFINGDAEFHAEGSVYQLKPYDLMLTRPFEMHRIHCRSPKPYERYVLYISTDYFAKNQCQDFAAIFENREIGRDNIISAENVRETLLDPLNRIVKYTEEKAYNVANAVLIEFLYLLNNTKKSTSRAIIRDKRISSVILYINENLGEKINLDTLADKFFIDKYHLCRIFKKSTGYTLNRYINHKRLLLVRELHAKGQSLLEASTNAGFNNYSHFYRMYVKENGEPPKYME